MIQPVVANDEVRDPETFDVELLLIELSLDKDLAHKGKVAKRLRPLLFILQRRLTLDRAQFIGNNSHNQMIAHFSGTLEQVEMARMEEIPGAVGQHADLGNGLKAGVVYWTEFALVLRRAPFGAKAPGQIILYRPGTLTLRFW